MERLQFMVSGRVQGVGFRFFTRDTATRLGISGWVRNRVDGSVELEAQGTTEQLAALHQALQKGPALAHVSRLVATPRTPIDGERDFAVRY